MSEITQEILEQELERLRAENEALKAKIHVNSERENIEAALGSFESMLNREENDHEPERRLLSNARHDLDRLVRSLEILSSECSCTEPHFNYRDRTWCFREDLEKFANKFLNAKEVLHIYRRSELKELFMATANEVFDVVGPRVEQPTDEV